MQQAVNNSLGALTHTGISGQLNTMLTLQEINRRSTCIVHNIYSHFDYTCIHVYLVIIHRKLRYTAMLNRE